LWIVEYFRLPGDRQPVAEFIDNQSNYDAAKILRGITLLEEFGPLLGMPHVRRMVGSDKLWELRIRGRNNISRVFFGQADNKLVLLHAIIKKSQKAPLRDIRLAEERFIQYLQERERDE